MATYRVRSVLVSGEDLTLTDGQLEVRESESGRREWHAEGFYLDVLPPSLRSGGTHDVHVTTVFGVTLTGQALLQPEIIADKSRVLTRVNLEGTGDFELV